MKKFFDWWNGVYSPRTVVVEDDVPIPGGALVLFVLAIFLFISMFLCMLILPVYK